LLLRSPGHERSTAVPKALSPEVRSTEGRPVSALAWAAGLDFAAAALHLAIIVGGANWYRFFGAGEQMAQWAEQGRAWPAVLTAGIALALAGFGVYTLSLGMCCEALPWRREVVWAITVIYAVRAGMVLLLAPWVVSLRTPFMLWSSLVCGVFAVAHGWALVVSDQNVSANPAADTRQFQVAAVGGAQAVGRAVHLTAADGQAPG